MSELDYPEPCNEEMINFVEWMVETFQIMDVWEFIKYILEKPQNFYEQYQEYLKSKKGTEEP